LDVTVDPVFDVASARPARAKLSLCFRNEKLNESLASTGGLGLSMGAGAVQHFAGAAVRPAHLIDDLAPRPPKAD
jgi:hypothetical protein